MQIPTSAMPGIFSEYWQLGSQIWRVLYHALEWGRAAKFPAAKFPILEIPTELLLHIFSFLPLPSKVCLALISKSLYRLFSSVLEAEELRFPRMPSSEKGAYVISEEYNLRMTLLIQLENESWACCGRCQRLHPASEFPRRQLRNHGPRERTCMEWAGIVDLCPCIYLTLRDRTRIVEYLKAPESNKPSLNLIRKGILSRNPGERYLLHQCEAYQNVWTEMRLSLTDSEELTTSTRYGTSEPKRPHENLVKVPLCCSRDWLDTLIPRSFATARLQTCPGCNAHSMNLTGPYAEMRVVHVARFLGRENRSGETVSGELEYQWYEQCRDLSEYIPIF